MSIPQHPFNAIVVGPYRDTRIVEQFIDQFQNYMWIDLKSLSGHESWEDIIRPLRNHLNGEPGLVLIKNVNLISASHVKSQILTPALYNSRHFNLSILILDKNGCSNDIFVPSTRRQISNIFVESTVSRHFIQRFYRHEFYEKATHLSTVFRGKQGWWQVDAVNDLDITPFDPWPRLVEWRPEYHVNFPPTVHERVLLLLMAQYDEGSCLSKLDRNCMMELLSCGAGMDENVTSHGKPKLELNGVTMVFTKSTTKDSYWAKRGMPNVYIHHSNFLTVIEGIISRQRKILKKNPNIFQATYIIIDQVPFQRCLYQTMDEKLDIYFVDSQLWNIKVKLPKEMINYAQSFTLCPTGN